MTLENDIRAHIDAAERETMEKDITTVIGGLMLEKEVEVLMITAEQLVHSLKTTRRFDINTTDQHLELRKVETTEDDDARLLRVLLAQTTGDNVTMYIAMLDAVMNVLDLQRVHVKTLKCLMDDYAGITAERTLAGNVLITLVPEDEASATFGERQYDD